MNASITTERVFSLSCFEALRLLRKYKADYPDLPLSDLLAVIDNVEADARNLDMEASVYLTDLVDEGCSLDGHFFYQSCIKGVLIKHQPIWAKLMRQGRKRFIKGLDPNDQDVFRAAGLIENPTPLYVVEWWDIMSGYTRLITDQEKMKQGRTAEILTLEFERRKLKEIGISQEPEWPGFDDNFAGYDVLSYTHGVSGITNILIEVKSTTVSPVRFIVSRNEWNKAEQAHNAYIFHVWDMNQSPPQLHVRSVADVAPHIPTDSGKGMWKHAEIPLMNH